VALEPAGFDDRPRAVCGACGCCWEAPGGAIGDGAGPSSLQPVDTIACPGCACRSVCESRPTWLAASMTQDQTLADGTAVLIRPLLYSDRFALAAAFNELSPHTRRLRFFNPPEHLDDDDLDYLTNIDFHQHVALAAFAREATGQPGVAVARYIRDARSEDAAEVAVTVADAYQRRGIGSLLLRLLADLAAERGIRTFVYYVLWDNVEAMMGLADVGARVEPDEPGVARIEIDLPAAPEADSRRIGGVLRAFVDLLRTAAAGIERTAGAAAPGVNAAWPSRPGARRAAPTRADADRR
jgi:GNAT superfamily N-acetyltransferase